MQSSDPAQNLMTARTEGRASAEDSCSEDREKSSDPGQQSMTATARVEDRAGAEDRNSEGEETSSDPARNTGSSHPLHKGAPIRDDDDARVQVLQSLDLLDSEPEGAFDRITEAAAATLKFPIALVSLVDKDRQWFKSRVGLGVQETHRDLAMCSHVVYAEGTECMVVSDTWQDDRFKYSDLVLGDPKIRAYAGVPLLYQRDGKTHKLGTLCVIDATPRTVTSDQISLLETMAKLVVAEIEIREKAIRGNGGGGAVKVHLFPRRKNGDQWPPEKGRLPIKVDRQTVESMFAMPQPEAARALGISLTSLKQVCRKLGISRWPYQRVVSCGIAGIAPRPPAGGLGQADAGSRSASRAACAGSGAASGGVTGMGAGVAQAAAPAAGGAPGGVISGQVSLDLSTMQIRWLSKDLEAAFEPTPFAILEQHLMHLVDPHYSRRLWSFLMGLTAARAGLEKAGDEAASDGGSFTGEMLLFRKRGLDVVGEMLQMQLGYSCEHSGKDAHDTIMLNMRVGPGPRQAMLPGAMTGGEMQALLQFAGQYVLDDLASETDYATISRKSSEVSGVADLWKQWESKITELKDGLPALPEDGKAPPAAARQHPSLECLYLLKELDPHSATRVTQRSTRLLLVPEMHGNAIALACHIRFATHAGDEIVGNDPMGAMGQWRPSQGMFLGLAGSPVVCNSRLQFHHSVGHFVATAFWEPASSLLHLHLSRLLSYDGQLKIYQTEHVMVSKQQGRNQLVINGTILGGIAAAANADGKASHPHTYRIVFGQVGSLDMVCR